MQSTKAFPDRSRTPSPPSKDHTSQSELDPTPDPKSLHKNETGVQAQAQAEAEEGLGWQPRLDRRQSWSNQDRKHYLQERLLNVEGSRERGFTEVNRGC